MKQSSKRTKRAKAELMYEYTKGRRVEIVKSASIFMCGADENKFKLVKGKPVYVIRPDQFHDLVDAMAEIIQGTSGTNLTDYNVAAIQLEAIGIPNPHE